MPIVPDLALDPGEKYIDLAIGVSFAAAIRGSDRSIQTWGGFAVPVNGSRDSTPPSDAEGRRFSAVTVGGGHGVAIEEGGGLYQWGAGKGTEPRPGGYKFLEVRSRSSYNLALDEYGDIYGWGSGLFAPPAPPIPPGSIPATLPAPHPLTGTDWKYMPAGYYLHKGPFKAIAAGGPQKTLVPEIGHVLALRPNGTVAGWGANTFGETLAPEGVTFVAIAAGIGFSLGLDDQGMLHHWGNPGRPPPMAGGSSRTCRQVLSCRSVRPAHMAPRCGRTALTDRAETDSRLTGRRWWQ